MRATQRNKRTMTFTADADLVDRFKEYCKERGINQSLALDTFMRCFVDERLVFQYENNRLVIVERGKNE